MLGAPYLSHIVLFFMLSTLQDNNFFAPFTFDINIDRIILCRVSKHQIYLPGDCLKKRARWRKKEEKREISSPNHAWHS